AHGGFAATGLADQRQRLAGIDAEADAVDRLDERGRAPEHRPCGDEMLYKIFDFEQGGHDTNLSSGVLMQRDQCAGLTATIGGGAAVQVSPTNGQRAAKRQPAPGLVMWGTMPSMGEKWEGAPP